MKSRRGVDSPNFAANKHKVGEIIDTPEQTASCQRVAN